MSNDPAEAFLVSLGHAQLLDASQLQEMRSWISEFQPDPTALAKELIRRGWLTTFQAKETSKGRARELTLGSYRLLELLGEGGMGRVFKAKHLRLGRDVALKVIRKEKLSNPAVVGRFRQEIHAAAQLSHPNVVLAFDAEEAGDGGLCLSMEYVEGIDLTKHVRAKGPMSIPAACDAIRQAATGLQHAFERGLVHRDVKPSNLLLTPRGQVKLLDLGLALLHDPTFAGGENATRVTQDGFVLGTPDFLAPEQAQNSTAVDIRADVYSLGATLFYLVTGRVPYEGKTATEKLLKHVTEPPPSVRNYLPDAPPQLDQLIAWFMAKRPEDRPQMPSVVAQALVPFCPPQPGSYPTSAMQTPAPFPQPFARATLTAQPVAINGVPGQPPAYRGAMPVPAQYAAATPSPFSDMSVQESADDEQAESDQRGQVDNIQVRRPKKRSNLPLVIFAGIAVMVMFVSLGSIGIWYFGGEPEKVVGPLEAKFDNSFGMTMVKIEPGQFAMGSPNAEVRREDNEGPMETVKLTQAFYLSATEVTQGQYLNLMGDSPSRNSKNFNSKLTNRIPVDNVSYDKAVEFCDKLTKKEKDRRPGWGYRLPTEAEWEYCARAGTSTPFAFGTKIVFQKQGIFLEEPEDLYWESNPELLGKKREAKPYPVAAKDGDPTEKGYEDLRRTPNAFGLFDMHGNLWEWCSDFYSESYPPGERTDPVGPSDSAGGVRVIRGGAWNETAAKARSASRAYHDPRSSTNAIGFRVVYAELKK